ncbi:hypothetical protein GW17_00046048 [Ensete ventricosum]|nr:hypothetical protein GW17_00046048 [Ensete ventricosum]
MSDPSSLSTSRSFTGNEAILLDASSSSEPLEISSHGSITLPSIPPEIDDSASPSSGKADTGNSGHGVKIADLDFCENRSCIIGVRLETSNGFPCASCNNLDLCISDWLEMEFGLPLALPSLTSFSTATYTLSSSFISPCGDADDSVGSSTTSIKPPGDDRALRLRSEPASVVLVPFHGSPESPHGGAPRGCSNTYRQAFGEQKGASFYPYECGEKLRNRCEAKKHATYLELPFIHLSSFWLLFRPSAASPRKQASHIGDWTVEGTPDGRLVFVRPP